ncbi:MAG: tRNA lysidine(34) synthetase TilS, partial [Ruminococcus sp.]|nr:tRNA lysidine(34) synthetase TilS [Ruminococcus sp.]
MKIDLIEKVRKTISKYDMINEGERLLAGLSGGADSVALLLCLLELGYDIRACHVNHCLRGAESDRDQKFCEELCERLGVELIVRRIDVKGYCQANSLSTEEGARILRYKAFEEAECSKICTAHNLDDCLETALFNLARGSGLKGISSIPPKRDNIVRPMIACSRSEIEEFLAQRGQGFVTDSTNLEDEYSRNKIRHKVIPVLKELNPSLVKTFGETVERLREDSRFLEEQADRFVESIRIEGGYDRNALAAADGPVRDRAIMKILSENGIQVSSERINAVGGIAANGGKVNVKQNCFAATRYGKLYFYMSDDVLDKDQEPVKVIPGTVYQWGTRRISFEILENSEGYEKIYKMFTYSCLDYDKIKG